LDSKNDREHDGRRQLPSRYRGEREKHRGDQRHRNAELDQARAARSAAQSRYEQNLRCAGGDETCGDPAGAETAFGEEQRSQCAKRPAEDAEHRHAAQGDG